MERTCRKLMHIEDMQEFPLCSWVTDCNIYQGLNTSDVQMILTHKKKLDWRWIFSHWQQMYSNGSFFFLFSFLQMLHLQKKHLMQWRWLSRPLPPTTISITTADKLFIRQTRQHLAKYHRSVGAVAALSPKMRHLHSHGAWNCPTSKLKCFQPRFRLQLQTLLRRGQTVFTSTFLPGVYPKPVACPVIVNLWWIWRIGYLKKKLYLILRPAN